MSVPNEFYSSASRSFVSTTTNGTPNGGMMENTMEASSNLEMTYENSLSSRSALPRQYFRYPLPVIPTTAASFPHSFLPSPFVPHYLSPPPLYYYHSSPYHHDSSSLLQARYLPNRTSPDSSGTLPGAEGKLHDPKWYSPGALQYHPPLPYYPSFAPQMSPSNSEHLQPYLPQCFLEPYAASHLTYPQSHPSQAVLIRLDFPGSGKIPEVFRPVSTSTPKFDEHNQPGNSSSSTEKLEDYSSKSAGLQGERNSVGQFEEQCTSTVGVGHVNPDSSMEDSDGRGKIRKGKRKASSETSSPRKRKDLMVRSHEGIICEGMRASNNVPSKPDPGNLSSCLKEESSYYKAELSSATTIVLRRSPQHSASWESTLSHSKCQTLLRAGRRSGVSSSGLGNSIGRNKAMLLKQKLFPVGVKPKGKRGRPRKYPTVDSKLSVEDSLTIRAKTRRFIGHLYKNAGGDGAVEEESDTEVIPQTEPEPDQELQNTNEGVELPDVKLSQPCVFLERIVRDPKQDDVGLLEPDSNSCEENNKSIPVVSIEPKECQSDGSNSEDGIHQGSCVKKYEESEISNIIADELPCIDSKLEVQSTPEIQVVSIKEQPKGNCIQEASEAFKISSNSTAEVKPKSKTVYPNSAIITDLTVESNSSSKIEVIDITDKNESATKSDANAAFASRKVKKDSEIAEPNKRNVVFSTSSERGLLRIPEKTLRLRVRGIDPVLNRKFKLKRDGPLFPKVPITYAEKKLEKIAISRMQNWFLNKEQGETYLHRAAKENDPEVTLYCLKFDGFHPRCTNNRGYTPLHEACKVGGVQVAKILLDHGAYHSQPAKGNIRPIHIASQIGNLELVELLLNLGANPFLTTVGGTNCFDLAESHQKVMKYLTEYFSLLPLPPSETGSSTEASSDVSSLCPKDTEP
ncbi:unnamed protein product [Allacma fusca]|uniref:Uncharacterized protein n=1 Tax=Allacma fusca TaxID=39272 RepID=A0A8J2LFS9_9HEXA|nr:unnamed protein product [Allacma fusca]